MSENTNKSLKSVKITCNIIDILQDETYITVTGMANELGHSKSTIHNHLSTLVEEEFVVKENTRYCLSSRYLYTAEQVKRRFENYDRIKREVDNLADRTGESAKFAIQENGLIYPIYIEVSDQGANSASMVGKPQPCHSTGIGKAILSHLPSQKVESILDRRGTPEKTRNTITSRRDLRFELKAIRRQGYAIDYEENILSVRCVAAPILSEGDVFGAISITGPKSRMTTEKMGNSLSETVKSSADVIELNSRFRMTETQES